MNVAVCGLGRMGTAFAEALLEAGHRVTVWNRTPGREGDLVAQGATAQATAAQAAAEAEVTVVMVFDAAAAEQVLFGPDGVVAGAAPGTLVVNATTVAPDESQALAERAAAAGLAYLEAPVVGSVPAARVHSLTVLVGGADPDAERAEPVLRAWSHAGTLRHVGPVGAATGLKLVANAALGVAAAGLHDAVRLGEDFGLPRELVLDVLAAGPLAPLVTAKRDRLSADSEEGYAAADFTVAALGKDLALALARARSPAGVVQAAQGVLASAARAGQEQADISVVGRAWRD